MIVPYVIPWVLLRIKIGFYAYKSIISRHGYLENLDMNETDIIDFSLPMWADVLRYYETIQLDKIHSKSYLELSYKIPQTCVLGHLFLFVLTEVYWKSNSIFYLLWIWIVYDKSIWYTAGSLSWAINAAYSFYQSQVKDTKKTFC